MSSELADCSYIGPWCSSYDLDLIDRRGIDKAAQMKRTKQKSYGAGVAAMTFMVITPLPIFQPTIDHTPSTLARKFRGMTSVG